MIGGEENRHAAPCVEHTLTTVGVALLVQGICIYRVVDVPVSFSSSSSLFPRSQSFIFRKVHIAMRYCQQTSLPS
jgi:hypothetical protein